jgi:uncharacterized protein (UPF0335 family)
MAKKANPAALHGLNEDQVKKLKDGVEKIEKYEERAAQIGADKRAEYDRLASIIEAAGFEKADIVALVGRRKKDRDRVVEKDRRVHKLEAALGMATADLFDEAANTMSTAKSGADATEASLTAGNADVFKGGPNVAEPEATTETTDEAGAAQPEPEVDPEVEREARKAEGRAAWARGAKETDCKYEVGSEDHALWITGWNECQGEWQADQAGNNGAPVPAIENKTVVPMTKPKKGAKAEAEAPKKLTGAEYRSAVGADL